jgi:hypothetical protein
MGRTLMANNGEIRENVDIDTSVENVIQYDKEGKKLFFDSDTGKFLQLPENVFRGLSSENQVSYLLAEKSAKIEMKQKENPPTPDLSIISNKAMAGELLDVIYPPGFREKWHVAWMRPDKTPYYLNRGYSYVTASDGVTSYGSQYDKDKNYHFVGRGGNVELVLLKLPLEQHKRMVKQYSDESKIQADGFIEESKDAMKRSGVESIDGSKV